MPVKKTNPDGKSRYMKRFLFVALMAVLLPAGAWAQSWPAVTWVLKPGQPFDTLLANGREIAPDNYSSASALNAFFTKLDKDFCGVVFIDIPDAAWSANHDAITWPRLPPVPAEFFDGACWRGGDGLSFRTQHGATLPHYVIDCYVHAGTVSYWILGMRHGKVDSWADMHRELPDDWWKGPGIADVVFMRTEGDVVPIAQPDLYPPLLELFKIKGIIVHRHTLIEPVTPKTR
jgi:hypothetical protein